MCVVCVFSKPCGKQKTECMIVCHAQTYYQIWWSKHVLLWILPQVYWALSLLQLVVPFHFNFPDSGIYYNFSAFLRWATANITEKQWYRQPVYGGKYNWSWSNLSLLQELIFVNPIKNGRGISTHKFTRAND